jgi:hypothetical protein
MDLTGWTVDSLQIVILSASKDLLFVCDVTNVDVKLYFVKQMKSTTTKPMVPQTQGQKHVPKTSTPIHPPSITFLGVQASRPILWL